MHSWHQSDKRYIPNGGQRHVSNADQSLYMEALQEARVLAMIICQFNERMDISSVPADSKEVEFAKQFITTHSLKKGLHKFGKKGRVSALKEMKQLLDRKCFHPIDVKSMSPQERKRALESLLCMTENRDGVRER